MVDQLLQWPYTANVSGDESLCTVLLLIFTLLYKTSAFVAVCAQFLLKRVTTESFCSKLSEILVSGLCKNILWLDNVMPWFCACTYICIRITPWYNLLTGAFSRIVISADRHREFITPISRILATNNHLDSFFVTNVLHTYTYIMVVTYLIENIIYILYTLYIIHLLA